VTRLLIVVALLALGCSPSLPAVQGWHSRLRARIHEVKSMGAMECAPRDLAQAQMAYRFAVDEIRAGDLARATMHLDEGMEAADRARAAGIACGVRGPVVSDTGRDPWIDQDGDGVLEPDDECPHELEDYDGFRDHDGCPDPDNDQDGIPDAQDPCPLDAEDMDGFQDEDGCPELDNDADGVNDVDDRCPLEPETLNSFEDDDGCPDFAPLLLVVEDDRIRFKRKLDFAGGMNVLLGTAHPALREVAEVLRLHGGVLRIEGHTHNRGDEAVQKRISEERAAGVRDFLLTQGVPADRLEVEGLGSSQPVSTNRTASGREANTRIELILLPAP
jgi:outer membrane protein OmpA-like peptidoglycan-associated protein